MGTFFRKHVATFVVAAVTAAVMAGLPALASIHTTTAAPPPPVIKTGFKDGPVAVPATLSPIAHMKLPAGKWTIFSKVWFENTDTTFAVRVKCQLSAGSNKDVTHVWVEKSSGADASIEDAAFNVSHAATSGFTVNLKCNAGGSKVNAHNIKITAIKAGTLTISAIT